MQRPVAKNWQMINLMTSHGDQMMKECFKCKLQKQVSEFYVHKQMADGYLNKCKECTKNDSSSNRAKNLERIRAYDRFRGSLRSALNKKKRLPIPAEWKVPDKVKKHANQTLSNAIRARKVVPWPVCAIPECTGKPEAHHPDYSRPLDVVWLCKKHHARAHHDYRIVGDRNE